MTEHFSLWAYFGWAVNAALELGIVSSWMKRKSGLGLVAVFAGFIFAADITRVCVLFILPHGYAYWVAYWCAQIIETVLRMFVSIDILCIVANGRKSTSKFFGTHVPTVTAWSVYAMTGLMAILFLLTRVESTTNAIVADLIAADILAGLFIACVGVLTNPIWPRGYTTAAWAIFFSICADLIAFLFRFSTGTNHLSIIRAFLPIAGALAMALLLIALSQLAPTEQAAA